MNHPFKPSLGAKLILAAGMLSTAALASTELERLMQDENQWAHPRKDYANTGYSKLAQINRVNVKNLKLS